MEAREAIERLSEKRPDLKEPLLFFSELITVQRIISEGLREKFSSVNFQEVANSVVNTGKPAVDFIDFKFEEKELKEAALKIISVVKAHREDMVEDLAEVESAIVEGALNLEELVETALREGEEGVLELADKTRVNSEILQALTVWVVQPFLFSIRDSFREHFDGSNWGNGYCPVCGSHTKVGLLHGEGGKLTLKCEVCGMEWPFKRIKCPFCGNEDNEKLGFYELEGGAYRLYFCDACGKYWKVVDERKLPGIPREFYPIITMDLDLLAKEEGYE